MFRIVHKRQLSDAVFEMGVEAPKIAAKARAGQFLMVRIGENEKGERTLTVVADDGEEEIHAVSMRTHLAPGIVDGAEVVAAVEQ